MNKLYFQILGAIITRTGKSFPCKTEDIEALMQVRKLAFKHHRQAENDCNGEGYIPRKGFFKCDSPSGYLPDHETTVFLAEMDKIESKINSLLAKTPFFAKYQGDPRGYTVKVFCSKIKNRQDNKVEITDCIY